MPRPIYVKKYVEKYGKLFNPPIQSSSGTVSNGSPATGATPVPESSSGITLKAIEAYFNDRLIELQTMSVRGDAWFFGSCCTFIDMLAWGAFYDEIVNHNQNRGQNGRSDKKFFNAFLKEYIFKVNSHYATLMHSLSISNDDLADKFYQTLRCGVVHSFSMKQSMCNGDGYEILLAHYHDFEDMSQHHLEVVDTRIEGLSGQPTTIVSFILVAEAFVQDIRKAVEELIKNAQSQLNAPVVNGTSPSAKIEDNLINLFKNKPPMGFLNIDLFR